jgi:hypothetical protein
MMNFSDETVEKVAEALGTLWVEGAEVTMRQAAKAALSSLTLADLMQVEEVREVGDGWKC